MSHQRLGQQNYPMIKNNGNTNDANARHEEINRTAAKIAATIN